MTKKLHVGLVCFFFFRVVLWLVKGNQNYIWVGFKLAKPTATLYFRIDTWAVRGILSVKSCLLPFQWNLHFHNFFSVLSLLKSMAIIYTFFHLCSSSAPASAESLPRPEVLLGSWLMCRTSPPHPLPRNPTLHLTWCISDHAGGSLRLCLYTREDWNPGINDPYPFFFFWKKSQIHFVNTQICTCKHIVPKRTYVTWLFCFQRNYYSYIIII